MDKKPLIVVSILAVVLLVLGSLSNVVGYQSVKSIVSDSPLFQTRTQRATNQQQSILTSQYLGMGKGNLLQFPFKDNSTEQLKKTIELISKMDDKTFSLFTELCIQRARQDATLNDINSNEIKQILILLRTKPDNLLNSFTDKNNQGFTDSQVYTMCVGPTLCIAYSVFAMLMLMIGIIIGTILIIIIYSITWTTEPHGGIPTKS